MKDRNRLRHYRGRQGFGLIELVTVLAITGILASVGFSSMSNYGRKQRARRAAQAVAWSVQVARSYAIRAGRPISLVVDEAKRHVFVRDATGTVAYRRAFGVKSNFALDRLDLDIDGDSLVFSRRGLCMNCQSASATNMFIEASSQKYTLEISLLGRTEIRAGKR